MLPEPPQQGNGAVWVRVDLHLHTPGTKHFSCPSGSDPGAPCGMEALAQEYVRRLNEADIHICAITDYNRVHPEWFQPIHDKAANYGITVLPGAEVCLTGGKQGLHVLAIFPEGTDSDEINAVLSAQDDAPGKPVIDAGGHPRLLSRDAQSAISHLREQLNALIIPCHPDQDKGILREFAPGLAAEWLASVRPDAIERFADARLETLISTGKVTPDYLERLAVVEFSDAHSLEEIGSKTRSDGSPRATWLKLSCHTLDAIRLALHDPLVRVALGQRPEPSHVWLTGMRTEGQGFLGNIDIEWNPLLNTLIGGRGTGKSAIIEALRYALDLDVYTEHDSRSALVRHALGSGGKVTVFCRRPAGQQWISYRVERVFGEDPHVYRGDQDAPTDLEPRGLFGPRLAPIVLGQREIYAVSGSAEYRRRLLDEAAGDETRNNAREAAALVRRLAENAEAILKSRKLLDEKAELEQRLATIQNEIAVYEQAGVAQRLKDATALQSDEQTLERAVTAVKEARSSMAEAFDGAMAKLGSMQEMLKKACSSQAGLLIEADSTLGQLHATLAELHQRGEDAFTAAQETLHDIQQRWTQTVQPLQAEIGCLKQQLHTDTFDPDRLLQLTRQREDIRARLNVLLRVEEEVAKLRRERKTLMSQLRQARLAEFKSRLACAQTIESRLDDRLKIEVTAKGDRQEFRDDLKSILRGSTMYDDAIERIASHDGVDGMMLAEAVRKGPEEIVAKFQLTERMAQLLCTWLQQDESRLFTVEPLCPPDAVDIQLRIGEEYRAVDRLSAGQRATAILLLLFALSDRILVVDQPEDDLDNAFVYEDLVQLLRLQKGLNGAGPARQIIAATHNANIPVLGDAELVLVLDATGGHAHVVSRTSIDDSSTREHIKRIMEGGEEAFRRRAEKYGAL